MCILSPNEFLVTHYSYKELQTQSANTNIHLFDVLCDLTVNEVVAPRRYSMTVVLLELAGL